MPVKKLGACPSTPSRFAENGITFAALRHPTDQDLKDIGVLLGPRRITLAATGELGSPAATTPSSAATAETKPQETAERAAPIPATATPGSIFAAVEAAVTGDQRVRKR